MFLMKRPEIDHAPRWRRMLAAAVDSAIVGGAVWLSRRRSTHGGIDRAAGWGRLFGPISELVRQQIGSPGQRLLGVRTVDRRTGRRPELWRTLVLLGADAGGWLLMRSVAPAPLTASQERNRLTFLDELNAIEQRHRDDPGAREAARQRLFERQPPSGVAMFARTAGPILVSGVLKSLLRRRLTPTTDALISCADSQSP
jgi:hypothetical protein